MLEAMGWALATREFGDHAPKHCGGAKKTLRGVAAGWWTQRSPPYCATT